MDKEKAIKVLLANACCDIDKLGCNSCPFSPQKGSTDFKDCASLLNDIIIEAVMVLNN